MSLKAFHIIFVAASVVLMAFLSGWAYMAYRETQAVEHLFWSACSGVSVVGLVAYGRFFLKKLRHVSFL